MKPSPKLCPLPPNAFLRHYLKDGHHTDCYSTDIPGHVAHEQFVLAFYSSKLFKLERFILKWAVSRPSSDAQLALLASGNSNEFAAWSVEERAENQLLLSDFQGRTRSWLMTAPIETETGPRTQLYFGSAVVPAISKTTGEKRLGITYKALLRFHKLYSIALLSAAAARLAKNRQ